jgi:16S rRNA (cytosine967-C5)-methyltransferase
LRRPGDLPSLAAQQKALLQSLWPLLRPGGYLLYCTCSVFKIEGEQQAQAFVANNTDALRLPAPGHLLPRIGADGGVVGDNNTCDVDGFFYALFQKAS